ncbi:hypothetical protein DFH09DRAFT_1326544 [Mycena vulgaris]|nr:hypothetical protein DFH09DRAFT_1326544 [Mycena vulgaris]
MYDSNVSLNEDMIARLAQQRQPLLPKLTSFRSSVWISGIWPTLLLGKVLIEHAGTLGKCALTPSGSPRLTLNPRYLSIIRGIPEEFHGLQFLEYTHFGNAPPIMGPNGSFLPRLRSLVIHLIAWSDRDTPPPVLALPSLQHLQIKDRYDLMLRFLDAVSRI